MSIEFPTDPSAASSPFFEQRTDLQHFSQVTGEVKSEIHKIIVGQEEMIELMLVSLLADGHILLEGVPGVAKTLSAKLLSKTLSVKFSRIQFTPDLMPSDVLGTSVFNTQTGVFEFKPGPIFGNIVLIDEINRAPAKTQAALFESMEERQITIDGQTHLLHPPYLVIATQNPIEQEGTYRLPEAQLDRFLLKIKVDYPTEAEEIHILSLMHERKKPNDLSIIQPILTSDQITQFQHTVRTVHIESHLISYIVAIVQATRKHKDLYLGASPRASLSIMMASKALAALRGRDFILPDDIQYVATPVLNHRIILTPEKEMEGGTTDEIIQKIMTQIEVPR